MLHRNLSQLCSLGVCRHCRGESGVFQGAAEFELTGWPHVYAMQDVPSLPKSGPECPPRGFNRGMKGLLPRGERHRRGGRAGSLPPGVLSRGPEVTPRRQGAPPPGSAARSAASHQPQPTTMSGAGSSRTRSAGRCPSASGRCTPGGATGTVRWPPQPRAVTGSSLTRCWRDSPTCAHVAGDWAG